MQLICQQFNVADQKKHPLLKRSNKIKKKEITLRLMNWYLRQPHCKT